MPQLTHIPGPLDRPRTRRTFGAYLYWLGRVAHRKVAHRTPTPVLHRTTEPLLRALNAIYPWSVRDYPGKHAMLAHILGLKPLTAARYLHPDKHVSAPQRHRERMAQFLLAKAAELQQRAGELRAAGHQK